MSSVEADEERSGRDKIVAVISGFCMSFSHRADHALPNKGSDGSYKPRIFSNYSAWYLYVITGSRGATSTLIEGFVQ